MDIRKIKKLIELLEESGIAEIEIKEGEEVGAHQPHAAGAAPSCTPCHRRSTTRLPRGARRSPSAAATAAQAAASAGGEAEDQ